MNITNMRRLAILFLISTNLLLANDKIFSSGIKEFSAKTKDTNISFSELVDLSQSVLADVEFIFSVYKDSENRSSDWSVFEGYVSQVVNLRKYLETNSMTTTQSAKNLVYAELSYRLQLVFRSLDIARSNMSPELESTLTKQINFALFRLEVLSEKSHGFLLIELQRQAAGHLKEGKK